MTSVINSTYPLHFPNAYGGATLSALFRTRPEDFYVEEILGFDLEGEGEHLCLYVEKQGHNTHWVSSVLAQYLGVNERDVGVCGRKDRHAITRQWFSLYDPLRKQVDWSKLQVEGITLLSTQRHSKKLRLGMHSENHFVIRLRKLVSLCADTEALNSAEQATIAQSFTHILQQGVPNYFGTQRFGHHAGNLVLADNWLANGVEPPRKQRSMVLSAARSYLFNQVLAYRVAKGNWHQTIAGDVLEQGWPTGPLWGRGRSPSADVALQSEHEALAPFSLWCERLEHRGLHQERRSLVLLPKDARCFWQNNDLIFSFSLPVGTFATAVLAECVQLHNQAEPPR